MAIGGTANGPWQEIANGSFPDPRLTPFNVPLTVTTPSGYNIQAGQVSYEVCHVKRKENCNLFLLVCEVPMSNILGIRLCSQLHWTDLGITNQGVGECPESIISFKPEII